MAITFHCKKCGASVRVGDQFAGRTGKCPSCKAAIKIPQKTPQPVEEEPILAEILDEPEDTQEVEESEEVEDSSPSHKAGKTGKRNSAGAWTPVGGGAMTIVIGIAALGIGLFLTFVSYLLPQILEPGDVSFDFIRVYQLITSLAYGVGAGLIAFGKFPIVNTPTIDDSPISFAALGASGLALLCFLMALINSIMIVAWERPPQVMQLIASVKWPVLLGAELTYLAYLSQLAGFVRNDRLRGIAGNGLMVGAGVLILLSFLGILFQSITTGFVDLDSVRTREEMRSMQRLTENVRLFERLVEVLIYFGALGLYAKFLWTAREALGGASLFSKRATKSPAPQRKRRR